VRTTTIANIPPFPAVALRVLDLLSAEDVRFEQLAEAIDSDPLFSAKILRVANSPLFGHRAEVDSVHYAIVTLGLSHVQALTMSVATATYMSASLKTEELQRCWHHSVASAAIFRSLARALSLPADRAYTAGLLHDIGRLGLLVAYPREYAAMLRDSGDDPHALLGREMELFGVDHCEAGQFLVEQWGLPSAFGPIASQHHLKPSGETSEWLKASYLACQMADSMGFSVIKPCQVSEFGGLCEMLPAAARQRFQDEAEALKAVIDLGISAHDSTVSSPPEPAVRGGDPDEPQPEVLPAPGAGSGDPEPAQPASTLSTQAAWKPTTVAAIVVVLAAIFIGILILMR
jgi:putative nucleotidyltransferase with HDIG domain